MEPEITEDALARLKQSEELFARAFLTNPLPMTITHGATERFTAVNELFLELVGYWRAEVIGHTSAELGLWPEHASRDEISRQMAESGIAGPVEGHVIGKRGTRVDVTAWFRLLSISTGESSVLTVLVPAEAVRG